MKNYLLICESSSRIVSFQVQLPRIWNFLVTLPSVTAFPIDLQCSNARGGRGTMLCRNDQAAGMQPGVEPGQLACLSDPSYFLCLWIIQKSHTLEVDRGAQWTLVCTCTFLPAHGQVLQAEIKVSTECCRRDWTARMNLFMGSLEVSLENVELLLE